MKIILKTNDVVRLSYARHLLEEAGIEYFEMDRHMANMEGSISAIPRRICVVEQDMPKAKKVLEALDNGGAK